ncbi:hypothetical protein TBLA_0D01680 [Henningerozyma blattae CBS 6284]|uniref:UmuC domain-containing protein n=1 Tax=Henningerozyma blattae (strain ATCC 34711 / CBS 6284 / DSM 70876 / NBRC 10599 / NRRL Y-10934 / UCD 77-7) TaxID=1071380 RepID=I2H2S4_HENB6|nr:hypothetical protein TBLA_0D01680 [Tetrapisispora blattae CBS 6284]CCH60676.1 hypothetical protein TBLA_0D01680 [Tetrapisispora blattae CBS 6284]
MSLFKWKDLLQLNSADQAYLSPLSCLGHIDANAFFAQVEQVRCGLTIDDPVVCVQWSSIIAVSYAARKHGISRMDSIQDAMKKCKTLKPIHTAVFKKGENFWQYHDGCGSWVRDKSKQLPAEEYKVALEPYRREGRKILRVFKEFVDLVEKASVDEVFLDFGRLCFQKLLFDPTLFANGVSSLEGEHKKNIQEMFVDGEYDLNDYLPEVPEHLKNISFDGLVYGIDEESTEPLIKDWDDVIFALASNISQQIRDYIKENVGYTTSCGIARTKSVCKLGSNFKKPDAQTIILNRKLENFLDNGNFEITSFWTLGGKLGKELVEILNLPESGSLKYIRNMWPNSFKELQDKLDESLKDTMESNILTSIDESKTDILARKIFEIARGIYCNPVNAKLLVKSMMSNKNLRADSCSSLIDAISWLEVFSGELNFRIQELEEEYGKILVPKTISIILRSEIFEQHTKASHFVSRGKSVTSTDILRGGTKLMTELDKRGKSCESFYPLKSLSLVISNFEIIDAKKSIMNMFETQPKGIDIPLKSSAIITSVNTKHTDKTLSRAPKIQNQDISGKIKIYNVVQGEVQPTLLKCNFCDKCFKIEKEFQEHNDFHVAERLSEGLNGVSANSKYLSLGEKRLLMNKRNSTYSVTKPSQGKKSLVPKKKSNSTGNIFKYFSK